MGLQDRPPRYGGVGITKAFHSDPGHVMLAQAVHDACWDVVMAGFNTLELSARDRVFAETSRRGIGVLCMFAVRTALSQPEKLREVVAALVQEGVVDPGIVDEEDPLGFARQSEDSPSLPEAGYRFYRAEPGIHVLSGTGNPRHREQNVSAILRPPLSTSIHRRLATMFARVDTMSGD
jgi:L-galactose dehydrogenase